VPPSIAPTIIAFTAERSDYWIGETARLTVRFAGGAGRIEPGIGPVADGASVQTPALDADRAYRLVVEGPQGRAERELRLAVRHRDRYVPAGTFVSTGHEALPLSDGSVLLIGGSRQEGVLSHRITRFDPQQRTFTDVGQLQVGRADHRATLLDSGAVLVTGGEVSLPQPRLIELIDARSGQSQAAGELAVKRSAHTATLLHDGRVLIAGGYSGGTTGIVDRAEIWDPRTRQSILLPGKMLSPRVAHTATRLGDGRVLLVGGLGPSAATFVAAEVFDPRHGTFTEIPANEKLMRLLHAAQLQADGSVLILGGEVYDASSGATSARSDVLRFDPVTGRLEASAQLAEPRSAVRLDGKDGRWFVFGGLGKDDRHVATAESFSVAAGSRALAPLPGTRAWHTVTRLADGRYLIAGGEDADRGYVSTALIYE
jgi:hypothetical protein